jgi:hypothetical protein
MLPRLSIWIINGELTCNKSRGNDEVKTPL